jgi:hypothetical protein
VALAHAHGFWVAAIACFIAGRAFAQPNDAAPAARAEPVVTVLIAGPERDVAVLEGALADPFRRLGVALRFEHPPQIDAGAVLKLPAESSPMLARLWFDLASTAHVPIYVTDGRHERIYTRDFPLARGLDDVAVEQLVYIARSSVDSILAGVDIGVRRDEYEASLEAPQKRPQPSETDSVKTSVPTTKKEFPLSASYEAQWMGHGAVSHGPTLGIGFARGHFALGLSAFYRFPFEVRGPELGARVMRVGARLDASALVDLGSAWTFAARLGSGVDFSSVTPLRAGTVDATPLGGFWVTDGVVRGTSAIGYRLRGGWVLSAATGVDLDLALVKYVLERGGARETVFVPFRARPFVGVELTAPL